MTRTWGASLLGSRRSLGAGLVVFVALLAVPFVANDYVTSLVVTGLAFLMLAVAWNLLAGYAGQISLGHAAFFGVGAYVTAWVTTPKNAGFPSWLATVGSINPLLGVIFALVVGGLGAAVVALVVGPAMFRLRGHYFAIGTLALAAIIRLVLNNQRSISGGATGYFLHQSIGSTGLYLLTVVLAALLVVASYVIIHSRLGLGMQAIHDDETAASGLGVSPLRYKMYAFVVTSFMAGLAGGAYALNTGYINSSSTLGVTWTVETLVVVVLGGMGTLAGPLFGTVVFMAIDNFLSAIVGGLATTVEGIIIILFVIFLPSGVYGYTRSFLAGGGGSSPPADEEPSPTES